MTLQDANHTLHVARGLPLPKRKYTRKWDRVFRGMEVGDSLPAEVPGGYSRREALSIAGAMRRHGFSPAIRKQEDGTFRVWRN